MWRLVVVYRRGERETRFFDFGRGRYVVPRGPTFCDLQTTVTASSIAAVLRAEVDSYGAMLGLGSRRVAVRLYEVHRAGASKAGDATDDPLARLLFSKADERFIDAELKALGF